MSTETKEPADLRAAYDNLKAEYGELQSQYRTLKTETTFTDAQLDPRHAKLFLASNPDADVTVESVKAFADEYNLVPAEAPGADPAPAEPVHGADGQPPAVERTLSSGPQSDLASINSAAGSPQAQAAAAAPALMSKEDFNKLLEANPEEAARAYAEGRVQRNDANVQADDMQRKGLIR